MPSEEGGSGDKQIVMTSGLPVYNPSAFLETALCVESTRSRVRAARATTNGLLRNARLARPRPHSAIRR